MNLSIEEQVILLKKCIDPKYWELNDWEQIISRATIEDDGAIKYSCSFVNLYFDNEGNLVDADPHWENYANY